MSKNAHEIIEKVKSDYLDAYTMVHGFAKADNLLIIYRSGWFYFNQKDAPPGLSTPYRASQVKAMAASLLRMANLRELAKK
jgi:hypothetical protein